MHIHHCGKRKGKLKLSFRIQISETKLGRRKPPPFGSEDFAKGLVRIGFELISSYQNNHSYDVNVC